MFTTVAQGAQKTFSAVAAIAIVAFGGLVMDQAHLAAAPEGRVEVGELTALDGATMLARLPEVVVVARRESVSQLAAVELPEVVVVARHVAQRVAHDAEALRLPRPSLSVGF